MQIIKDHNNYNQDDKQAAMIENGGGKEKGFGVAVSERYST